MLDHIEDGEAPTPDSTIAEPTIAWLPDGSGFKINDRKLFAKHTLPKYFDTLKYKSFIRQINIYGFVRKTKDVAKNDAHYGAYVHPCFVRGQPDLCWQMTRCRIKGTGIARASRQNEMQQLLAYYK